MENYVFLMNADQESCRLNQNILKEAGIHSQIKDYTTSICFNMYGANPPIGKKLLVPKSKLKEAKEILEITDNKEFIIQKILKKLLLRIGSIVVIGLIIFGIIQSFRY